ncbi:MAG TPA: bifunctional 4-hydroxy-2-oxoglutarate aldolase/2-dehydro-3-deoxy-phosphogluconate aldolase [Alphaproteobacteria bacterium]|nr:bifunctional 4-hydroxy-2-oxoglutarate aldolase/2-dehydro-3-deoxy-phosphogluconate aldolase [Alphaproteobacteria bacterium]
MDLAARMTRARIVPVLSMRRLEDAVPLARALHAGGLDMVEVTLRTPAGLGAIQAISKALPGVLVGAGTVTRPEEIAAVRAAGAGFAVSPGFTADLAQAAVAQPGLPYLPGIATASELMAARAAGFTCLKFFPAEAAGGTVTLKAFAGPFPEVRFCPTGGISAGNVRGYLSLANVVAVGGSWVAPEDAVEAADWGRITDLARAALSCSTR